MGDKLNTNTVSEDFASLPAFVGQRGFVAGVNCGGNEGSVWMSLQEKLEDREGQLAGNAPSA